MSNENLRVGMAMLASTIAGAIFASGSARDEMTILFIVEEKMQALFPTVEHKEILLACSHAMATLGAYQDSLGHFDKPTGGIQ
ncbi:hypothetical protein [Polynucleobacter yangtzensis]|nr:hypothetical protein [Polynucleobacter yangtzensis]